MDAPHPTLLTEIAEADGKIREQEELVIGKVPQILDQEASVTSYVRKIAAAQSKALSWATRKFLVAKRRDLLFGSGIELVEVFVPLTWRKLTCWGGLTTEP